MNACVRVYVRVIRDGNNNKREKKSVNELRLLNGVSGGGERCVNGIDGRVPYACALPV